MKLALIAIACFALANADPFPYGSPRNDAKCGQNKYDSAPRYGDSGPLIVGGQDALVNEFPYQVSLQRSSHTCGGSIIDKRWILSAAHCFSTTTPSRWKVIVGMHKLYTTDSTQKTVYVEKIVKHPQYSSYQSNKNDIALMKLKEDLVFNDAVQPVCLADKGYPTDDEPVVATGWGTTSSGGLLARTLQKVTVPAITNEECAKAYPREKIHESTLCAGDLQNGGIDACQGDSGGPLVHLHANGSLVEVGITSWGYGCAAKGYPGVYTRVSEFYDWIWDTVNSK